MGCKAQEEGMDMIHPEEIPFEITPVPEFRGYNADYLHSIVKYLYMCIDREYNKAYALSCGKDIPPLRFEIYIDDRSFALMRSAADYRDLEKDYKTGDVTFRGHKVLVVKTHVNHLRVVRVA